MIFNHVGCRDVLAIRFLGRAAKIGLLLAGPLPGAKFAVTGASPHDRIERCIFCTCIYRFLFSWECLL